MSPHVPSRQLLQALWRASQFRPRACLASRHQYRFLTQTPQQRGPEHRKPLDPERIQEAAKKADQTVPRLNSGALAPSIFDSLEGKAEKRDVPIIPRKIAKGILRFKRIHKLRLTVRDPTPLARLRWLRKKVIQDVRGRHRLSRTEKILKTEREHLSKSPFIKTSIKKLGPLARQIAGKPVDDAILQMRFSKKKAAQDVLKHLRYARDQAIVGKGMGLGKDIAPGVPRPEGKEEMGMGKGKKTLVIDKNGKRRVVTDRTAMYVDQAWVGRGTYDFAPDYRARGKVNRLRLPWTSISLVLKEEATRIRQQEEREQKARDRKPWVHLPNRPVTAQRQYPLW